MTASTVYVDITAAPATGRAPSPRGPRAVGRALAAFAIVATGLGLTALAVVAGLLTGLTLMLAALALLPVAIVWSRLQAWLATRGASDRTTVPSVEGHGSAPA